MADTGQVLEAELEELLKKLMQILDNARKRRATTRILRTTLRDLGALLDEIKHYNEGLNCPRGEIGRIIEEKEAQEKIVRKCAKIPRFKYWLSKLIVGKKWRVLMERNLNDLLCKVRDILVLLSKEKVGTQMKGPCDPPENPGFTVGLDKHMTKLKMELLKDGANILGLTGFGGSGKTTLATKLCWDDQVRGKFRDNILFVTFSKTPNLKIIVQALFQHFGYRVPEFQSNECAVKGLELLLKQLGERPVFLVLDDVWPGSESVVENFKFQMSDYKILVISRIALPRFGTPCPLGPLSHEDSIILFSHFALLKDNTSHIADEDLVEKVVKGCRGSPLALKVIGKSLCQQPFEVWQKLAKEWSQGHSIIDSNTDLLSRLRKSLDVLEGNKPIIKECFMDLGLFPEDQRIPVTALIDMWVELYELDDDGIEAMSIIEKLASMNLANVLVTRKVVHEKDNFYNNHFIMQHDLLRDLAIYQINQEPFGKRKRLIIDINENNHESCKEDKLQRMIAHILSMISKWCVKQKQQQVQQARTLSISTDETFNVDWCNMQATEAEVLILNLRTKQCTLPEFIEKMRKLKVLIVTNYGFHPSELNNVDVLGSSANLKRIRLEQVSVRYLGKLKNVEKLSLYMCNTSQAFGSSMIPISDALPNLVELNIDYCKDMVKLPAEVCDITPLKKLSITNCHKFSALPQEIGKLENLELLRLSSCTSLVEVPDSITRLHKLSFLDISYCVSLSKLPEDIGNLNSLKKLFMTGCSRCELPVSIMNLGHLNGVICDEETAASWQAFQPMLPNLRIEVPNVDITLSWLPGFRS